MNYLIEAIQAIGQVTEWLSVHGIWDALTFFSALSISFFLRARYRKRIPKFSVHCTYYTGTSHPLYPNTLNFEVRNLMDAPVVITNANFRFSRCLNAGSAAHGNTATGDYEIKFRPIISSGGEVEMSNSYTSLMLRHRQTAFCYVPFDNTLTSDNFCSLIKPRRYLYFWEKETVVGVLTIDIVLLREGRPQVVSMEIPIKNPMRAPHEPPLGGDGHPRRIVAPNPTA